MASTTREVRAILKALMDDHGCECVKQKSGHWKVSRAGFPPIIMSHSPSDHRAVRNMKADVRRLWGITL